MQTFAYNSGQILFFHGQRRFIEIFHIQILEHMAGRYIAEEGNLVLDALIQGIFRTADDNVRLDTHTLQVFDAGLGRLGLHLLGGLQIGDQGHVDQDHIFPALFMLELPDRLKEGLAFNVSYSPAHFDDCDLCMFGRRIAVETAFDLISDMGDHLDSASAEISPPFLLEDRPVDLSGGHIGILGKALVDKSFIVA